MGERVLLRFFKQNSKKSNSEKPNGSFSNISQMFLKYRTKIITMIITRIQGN